METGWLLERIILLPYRWKIGLIICDPSITFCLKVPAEFYRGALIKLIMAAANAGWDQKTCENEDLR